MKFMFFNIVVGAALVYLVTGGSPEVLSKLGVPSPVLDTIEDVKERVSSVESVIKKVREDTTSVPKAKSIKPQVIPTKDVDEIKQEPVIASQSFKPKQKLPELTEPTWIPETKTNQPDEMLGTGKVQKQIATAVQQRRDEILGKGITPTPQKSSASIMGVNPAYTMKDGEQLMSPSQRRRELRSLVEEMELLYLDKAGS
jgi:hypothetical protein